jgi:hypothetical protein
MGGKFGVAPGAIESNGLTNVEKKGKEARNYWSDHLTLWYEAAK